MATPNVARPISDLLEQLKSMSAMPMNSNNRSFIECGIRSNPYRSALMDTFISQKEIFSAKNVPKPPAEDKNKENVERLDRMLEVDGIMGNDSKIEVPENVADSEKEEFRGKMEKLRKGFNNEMNDCEQKSQEFVETVRTVVTKQREFRPVFQKDIDQFSNQMTRKINAVMPTQLKQVTCERLVELKKKYCDARRKRKNFSKSATKILNDYFYGHIANPYPNEEMKIKLAEMCQITVAQVANWFGNKRIRHKKNGEKNIKQQETKTDMPPSCQYGEPSGYPGMYQQYQYPPYPMQNMHNMDNMGYNHHHHQATSSYHQF